MTPIAPIGTVEIISHQKARSMVTRLDWIDLQRCKEVYSFPYQEWVVYKAGCLYKRRKCSPNY